MFLLLFGFLLILIYAYFKNAYKYWSSLRIPQLDPIFPFGDMADVIFR